MVASVSIQHDIGRAMRQLSDQAKRQIPFAAALAITRTAKSAEQDLRKEMASTFDSPTPYIAKGTFSTAAKKASLEAWVGMRDQARRGASPATYVREHFAGGARGMKPFERALAGIGALPDGWKAIPAAGLKLDRHGSPDRKTLAEVIGALRSRTSVYSGRRKQMALVGYFVVMPGTHAPRVAHLAPGIWRRIQRGRDRAVLPVFTFAPQATYTRRLDLQKIARAAVERDFRQHFNAAFQQALSTAR